MIALTRQERVVLVFLTGLALFGLGLNFAVKISIRPETYIVEEDSFAKIDINGVDYSGLAEIKGISPKLARKIIDFRDKNGPIRELEELKKIKGVGDYRLRRLKEYLTVR